MSNSLPDDVQKLLQKEISKEVQRNVKTEVAPEIIPFHALPIYKASSDFVLNKDEMDIVVDGEFRQALSKQGNAISKSAEILDDERLLRVKTHILTVFNDYVILDELALASFAPGNCYSDWTSYCNFVRVYFN